MIPRHPRRDCRRAFGAVFRGFDAQDARTEPRPIVALDYMTLAGFDDPIGTGSLSQGCQQTRSLRSSLESSSDMLEDASG